MTTPNQLDKVWSLCQQSKDFRQQWEGLYDKTMQYVRIHCVELLSDNDWQDIVKYQSEGQAEIVKRFAHGLLSDVVQHFDEKIEKCENSLISDKMSLVVTRDDLKKTYENDPCRFVETLVRCLNEEEMLINNFEKPSEEEEEKTNITLCIRFLNDTQQQEELLKQKVKDMTYLIDKEKRKITELDKKKQEEIDIKSIVSKTRKNGMNSGSQKIQKDIQTINIELINISLNIDTLKQGIKETLMRFLSSGVALQAKFSEVLTRWKHDTKFRYVYLIDSEYSLKGIIERCKKFGKLVYSTLNFIVDDLPGLPIGSKWDMEKDIELQSTINSMYQLFEELCQSTFLVIDQVRHLVKVELGSKKRTKNVSEDDETKPGQSFKCPKFNAVVRLLATEAIDGRRKVKAYFCHQQTLNDLNKNNNWEDLENESFPLHDKGNSRLMAFGHQGVASFRHLELTNFKRDPDKQVCEEKYRIVFTTEQVVAGRTIKLRTLSLPIVITTGASQGSNAHGSLLWQCFSVEDVMKFPLESPSVLPWSTVAAMMNSKFKTLGGRDLRSDELQHLASKVSGIPTSNLTKDTDIQFRKFCLDKMMDVKESREAKNKSATFWMWVLSVFNLTRVHLQEYWCENLIYGFSSKEDSERKLKSVQPFKPYTFLLRFSDHVITDGQGQNMCGAISTVFVYKTEEESLKVGHARPFKAENFKKKSLAQLIKSVHLKETEKEEVSLQWLYPGLKSRDEAFQSFYQPSVRTKEKDDYYLELIERLEVRLKNFTTNEDPYTKEEPVDELPVGKKCKTSYEEQTISSNEQQTILTPLLDQNVTDLMSGLGLEKMSQPSPSSTIFGGDARNSNESTPFSQEQSPASSYMMSPHTDHENAYSITSPQSSIDESQVLSPEQEASIPVTVLDKMGVNGNPGYNPAVSHSYSPTVNGSHSYSPAVNGNLVYNQSEQVYNRSHSLPEQHPTLTTLLTASNSKDELRTKILSKNTPINGQELTLDFSNQGLGNIIMQQPPNFHQQQNNIQLVDLNTLQNYTNGMTELQQTNIDMTSNNHLENIVIESEDIGLEEEIVEMNERYEITEDQLQLLASLGGYRQQNQQANTINNSDTNPFLNPGTLAQILTLLSDPNNQINMQ